MSADSRHIFLATAEAPRQGPWARRIEAFVVRHRHKLAWIHIGMFFGFMALLIVPLCLPLPGDDATIANNFTRFANYLIWGLWFPLVFVSVIFAGRLWCGVLCPLGAASEWANGVGLKRPVPRWVRWRGTPIVSFMFITILGQTVGVRDYALAIAEVFGFTFVGAILLGLMYGQGKNKRAWCRHMCPIGLMLGVFSRIGAVQFTPKRRKRGGDAYTNKGVCPTMIDINRKEESRHCIECFRCVHPKARGGLKMLFRRPGEEVARIRDHNPNAAEIWFLFLATGVSLGGFLWLVLPQYQTLRHMFGVWAIEHGWYWIGMPGPAWLMSVHPEAREVFTWLDFFMITGFMLACAALLSAVLVICTSISARLAGWLGADSTRRKRFVELAYQYMPVAMVSLVIGLGGELFNSLELAGLSATTVAAIKALLFAGSLAWSIGLGHRLAGNQGLRGMRRWAVLTPCVAGSLIIGLAWWPAIFGM
ncbi:MAG TPA: 4Fe-4S binding protein [Gammaproteobacteria bacterium]|nr:4Fe-4S binding protein [Gammaproteobacteria bacterium]